MFRSKNRSPKILLFGALMAVILLPNSAFSQNMQPPDMPHPRFGMCSARLGDKLYLIGGATMRMQGMQGMGTTTVDAFDFENMSWDESIAPLNTPRAFATAVALDDSIYVMGGVDDQGNVLSSVEVYDPNKNGWHYTSSMQMARKGAAATAFGDYIMVFGGGGSSTGPYREVEAYSLDNGSWTVTIPMVFGRAYHKVFRVRNAIYIFGGNGGSLGLLSFIEKYVPSIGPVQISVALRRPRMLFGIAARGDSVFVVSGAGPQSNPNLPIEMLDFHQDGAERDTELTSTVLDTPRVGFVAAEGEDGKIYLFGGVSPDYKAGQFPISSVGTISVLTAVKETPNTTPTNFKLSQNYPNPFNPTTTIEFNVPLPGAKISLDVYNILGENVKTLVNGYLQGGRHVASFDGRNMPSGTYIYRLQTENGSTYRKMVLIK
ncbi:MAG: T9SS type A sorting domain-containing protein [Bacteroidetes bacterium]|nr:T9SS type A sorting domain-containing protein [Bacteroidota bacterium]MCL5738505.1 T9SS type A sorting domain-containing protein [Bacteroidota bacterium]